MGAEGKRHSAFKMVLNAVNGNHSAKMKMEQWIAWCCDATKKNKICVFIYLSIVSGRADDKMVKLANGSRYLVDQFRFYIFISLICWICCSMQFQIKSKTICIYLIWGIVGVQFPSSRIQCSVFMRISLLLAKSYEMLSTCTFENRNWRQFS